MKISQKIWILVILLGSFQYAYADVCADGFGDVLANGTYTGTGVTTACGLPELTNGVYYLYEHPSCNTYWNINSLNAASYTAPTNLYYSTGDSVTGNPYNLNTGTSPGGTVTAGACVVPGAVGPVDLTTGSATSSVEQIQTNLFHGWVVFGATAVFVIWFFRRKNI